jgi:DNA-binding transcriptional LysR family regulator
VRRINFELDVLRSFAVGMELGSFAKAADCLGRSTSAVSAQLKKLEEQAGTPLFRKAGRHLALTEAGEVMLAYARRLIALNDEAASALGGVNLEGWVRLGVQEGVGEVLLPQILGQFARAHPKVKVEARIARKAALLAHVASSSLDLALAWDDGTPAAGSEHVATLPMRWIGPSDGRAVWSASSGEPLPLAASEAPCIFRAVATAALDRAGIPWRIAFTSPSLAGLWAATEAGLGLTVLTELGLPARVGVVSDSIGLPAALPGLTLSLYRADANPEPAAARLADIVRHAVRDCVRMFDATTSRATRTEGIHYT